MSRRNAPARNGQNPKGYAPRATGGNGGIPTIDELVPHEEDNKGLSTAGTPPISLPQRRRAATASQKIHPYPKRTPRAGANRGPKRPAPSSEEDDSSEERIEEISDASPELAHEVVPLQEVRLLPVQPSPQPGHGVSREPVRHMAVPPQLGSGGARQVVRQMSVPVIRQERPMAANCSPAVNETRPLQSGVRSPAQNGSRRSNSGERVTSSTNTDSLPARSPLIPPVTVPPTGPSTSLVLTENEKQMLEYLEGRGILHDANRPDIADMILNLATVKTEPITEAETTADLFRSAVQKIFWAGNITRGFFTLKTAPMSLERLPYKVEDIAICIRLAKELKESEQPEQTPEYRRQHILASVAVAIYNAIRSPEEMGMVPDFLDFVTSVAPAIKLCKEVGEKREETRQLEARLSTTAAELEARIQEEHRQEMTRLCAKMQATKAHEEHGLVVNEMARLVQRTGEANANIGSRHEMVAISNEITRCLNSDQEAQSELNKKKEEAEAQLQLFFKKLSLIGGPTCVRIFDSN